MVRVYCLCVFGRCDRLTFFQCCELRWEINSSLCDFCSRLFCSAIGKPFLRHDGRSNRAHHALKAITHHDGSANCADWMLADVPAYRFISTHSVADLAVHSGICDGRGTAAQWVLSFEASSDNSKSLLCSIATTSMNIGVLFASFTAFLLFSVFDRHTILAWAWRLPFLLGLPMTVAINNMRYAIREPPLKSKSPLDSAWRVLKQPFMKAIPLVSWLTVFGFVLVVWMPSYLIHFLNYPPSLARLIHTFMLIALVPLGLAAGAIAHFWGYQRLIKFGVVTTIILTYPLWIGLQSVTFGRALATLLLLAVVLSSINGIIMETLARQFPNFVRCRGMNLAYTLPVVFLGGTTPLICTWMIQKTGLLMFPAFYIMFFGLLALPAAWRLKPIENALA